MPDIAPAPQPESRLPRLPDPARVRRIATDAEALDAARGLAAEFAPGAAERDRARLLPWDELDRWSESGLGGITVPRDHGGADVSYATLAEVFVILSAADASLGQIPQNHYGLLGLLREGGSNAQKRRFFGEVLAGRRLGNAGPERKSAVAPTIFQGITRLRTHAPGPAPHGAALLLDRRAVRAPRPHPRHRRRGAGGAGLGAARCAGPDGG